MNFYIGNSIEKLNYNSKNVEISDEILEYLNKRGKTLKFENSNLLDIDPYEDTIIENSVLPQWLFMCESIVSSNALDQYTDLDAINGFNELIELIKEAINKNFNLFLIGD